MNANRGFKPVFLREFHRVLTSKVCIWGLIIIPLIFLSLFAYMIHEGQPRKLPTAVVDLDNSASSRSLIRQLDAFAKVDIKYRTLSFSEATQLMNQGKIYAILYIPSDFSKDATSGQQPKLTYYTNNAFILPGSLLFQDLKTISTLASASVGQKVAIAKGYRKEQFMPVLSPISTDLHPLSNPYLNYSIYLTNVLVPAVIQLMLMMLTVSCLGTEIKEGKGTALIRLSGNSITKTILGKLLPYTIISTIISLFIMSILYGYLHFPLKNGFFPMFINYVLMILASQSIGVILFALFRNYRLAMSVASLIGVVSFSLMGMSFPVQAMSSVLQSISLILPMRHFLLIHADQALNGYPVGYSLYHYAAYFVFIFIAYMMISGVKKELKRNVYEP